jgi:hypothetical protein
MLDNERTDSGKEVGGWEGMPSGQTKIYLKLHNLLVLTIIMIKKFIDLECTCLCNNWGSPIYDWESEIFATEIDIAPIYIIK